MTDEEVLEAMEKISEEHRRVKAAFKAGLMTNQCKVIDEFINYLDNNVFGVRHDMTEIREAAELFKEGLV